MRRFLPASTRMLGLIVALAAARPALAGAELDASARDRLRPVVPAAIEYFNQRATDPLPTLSRNQVEELLDGGVVKVRRRTARDDQDPPERVTGYRIVACPRDAVWVAALDPGFRASDLLSEARLRRDADGTALWHQYLSLPWPVADRQWVIRVGVHPELSRETGGLIWEQRWTLATDGPRIAAESVAAGNLPEVSVDQARQAVYVPANEGSWILFRLEDSVTLVAYRVIARVGGKIPDSWIASFGMAQLGGVLDAVAAHARDAATFYDPGRHPIVGGDGQVVPALETAPPRRD